MRQCGILLHITSLPSPYGIGTLGREAFAFADFLAESGQAVWQVLPLGPTGYGDSPYSPSSAFALNPYLIDLRELTEQGLLKENEYSCIDFGSGCVDYGKLFALREGVLLKAAQRFDFSESGYLSFCRQNAFWLDGFALYSAAKKESGYLPWDKWKEGLRLRESAPLQTLAVKNSTYIDYIKFTQYQFYRQWKALKAYANSRGVRIMGDMPIYCACDSSDVWENPSLFMLDKNLIPTAVAGVPPDGFSEDGQLWGNPLYDWQKHREQNYGWWKKRMEWSFEMFDIIRIDHFRGFESFYAVPFGDKNAKRGRWLKGPGAELFTEILKAKNSGEIVAENLGFLDDSVQSMLEECGFPGMKVLQFAFDGNPLNVYLPHLCGENNVIYTGTHDNMTLRQWYSRLAAPQKNYVRQYLGIGQNQSAVKALITSALSSRAKYAVIPIQDYLGLGISGRMNSPSEPFGNWQWRLKEGQLTRALSDKILKTARQSNRI